MLEGRQLLTASLAGGVLTVTGTAGNDQIAVSLNRSGETITVHERTGRAQGTHTPFVAADVTSIVVNGGTGHDRIALGGGTRATPLSVPALLNGEDGNDFIRGAAGDDTVNGGAGNDRLFGGAGDDLLSGGDGRDLLVGGPGVDTLQGNAGNDLLHSKGDNAIDILDGGTDDAAAGDPDRDRAIIDTGETATNATVVTRPRPLRR